MASNVISFESERLDRAIDSVFGEPEEERALAAINSRIEFIETELKTMREYIELSYAGSITIATDDDIDAPESWQWCEDGTGGEYRCGKGAAAVLDGFWPRRGRPNAASLITIGIAGAISHPVS